MIDMLSHQRHVVIYVYDAAKLGGNIVVDIVRTHALVPFGVLLQENPIYGPPDKYLRERAERQSVTPATW